MVSIKNLFYSSYWFEQPLIARGWIFAVWLGAFLALMAAGAIILIARNHYRADKPLARVLRSLAAACLTMGAVGLLWFWFRQERVAFLAWRFWLWLWFAGLALWLAKAGWYAAYRLPLARRERAEESQRAAYLPAKKK